MLMVAASIYFARFPIGEDWEVLGTETELAEGTVCDLVWLTPDGRVIVDELKTGRLRLADLANLDFVSQLLRDNGFLVVGGATTGTEALDRLVALTPNLAILDVRMPGLSGIEITRELTRKGSRTRVILYTGYDDEGTLLTAIDAGAFGFVGKDAPVDVLLSAVRTVAAGGTYIDATLGQALARRAALDRHPAISKREQEVLALVSNGLDTAEIGRRLFISPSTVRSHVERAMAKLAAETRAHAVALAIRQLLIP